MRTHRQKKTGIVKTVRNSTYGNDWRKQSDSIKKRDNYTCQKCGKNKGQLPIGSFLEVHHIRSLSKGGINRGINMITLCSNCHAKQPGHKHLLKTVNRCTV